MQYYTWIGLKKDITCNIRQSLVFSKEKPSIIFSYRKSSGIQELIDYYYIQSSNFQ